MIKIENAEVEGLRAAARGMRNPLESWDKADSHYAEYPDDDVFCVGYNDLQLMMKLCKAGKDHRKFMRMIILTVDITAPLYWWKEFDTYKVGTVRNSCSTMHTIHKRDLMISDFSYEHVCDRYMPELDAIIAAANDARRLYLETGDKDFWYSLIQILPSSFNQRATVMLNYETLRNMYHARRNHKLDEWREFCEWLHDLPYSELITEDFSDGS